jgi:hypothetical protein
MALGQALDCDISRPLIAKRHFSKAVGVWDLDNLSKPLDFLEPQEQGFIFLKVVYGVLLIGPIFLPWKKSLV